MVMFHWIQNDMQCLDRKKKVGYIVYILREGGVYE